MNLKPLALTAALLAGALGTALVSPPASAQAREAREQFFPLLVYRTGPYAPNGTPLANGKQDYIKLVNARDGGVNGVKLTYEECETGYATDKGVECYERLKGRPGVALFEPQTTGVTFALTDKVPADKMPLITPGYGLSISQDGQAFKWNFPLMGSYWTAADIIVQGLGKKEGGMDKLKGKKIALVYHDSPFGKEPIPLLQERSKMHGFELSLIPVTAPGIEQKSAWLQVRQQRPDYVILWGWGVMNSAALKEAVATGYPREKMYGVWWSGAEPDVKDVGQGAKGYNALTLHASGQQLKAMQDILQKVHDKGNGSGYHACTAPAEWDEWVKLGKIGQIGGCHGLEKKLVTLYLSTPLNKSDSSSSYAGHHAPNMPASAPAEWGSLTCLTCLTGYMAWRRS